MCVYIYIYIYICKFTKPYTTTSRKLNKKWKKKLILYYCKIRKSDALPFC